MKILQQSTLVKTGNICRNRKTVTQSGNKILFSILFILLLPDWETVPCLEKMRVISMFPDRATYFCSELFRVKRNL